MGAVSVGRVSVQIKLRQRCQARAVKRRAVEVGY
jgi:hypothetical protein